jgi:hypothetical protein
MVQEVDDNRINLISQSSAEDEGSHSKDTKEWATQFLSSPAAAIISKNSENQKGVPVWQSPVPSSADESQGEKAGDLEQEKEKVTPFKKRKATRRSSPIVETQLCDLKEDQLTEEALMTISSKKKKAGLIARKENQVQEVTVHSDASVASKAELKNINPNDNADH